MSKLNLSTLVAEITRLHHYLQQRAQQQVNSLLTIRNWLIGFYIVEYEQEGEDRAEYGKKILAQLAKQLKTNGIKGLDERALRTCRSFYQTYPQIWGAVSAK